MRRDNEYLRDLLFEFESDSDYLIPASPVLDDTEKGRKRWHHIQLLEDYGYILETGIGMYRLTSQGHDFIESIRDEGIWEQTKKAVTETGGNVTIEMIKSIACGFLKKKIQDHTGIVL